MPLRKLALSLLAAGIFIVIAAVALWASTPQWAPLLLRRQLAPLGWQLDTIVLQRPRTRALHIERLVLTQPGTAVTTVVDARAIDLSYDLASLRRGRIERADIAQLHVELQHGTAPESPREPLALGRLLPSAAFARLPLASAQVRELQLQTPWPRLARAAGDLDYRDRQLQLHLRQDSSQPLALQLRADGDNRIALSLHDGTRAVASLDNRIGALTSATAAGPLPLSGRAELDLDALQALLPPNTAQLHGRLAATWRGQLPEQIGDDPLGQLTLDGTATISADIESADLPRTRIVASSTFQLADRQLTGIAEGSANTRWPAPAPLASRYRMRPGEPLPIAVRLVDGSGYRVDLAQRRIALTSGRIEVDVRHRRTGFDARAALDRIALDYGEQPHAELHLAVTTPEVPLGAMQWRAAQLDSALTLTPEQISGRWQLRGINNSYRIEGRLNHRIAERHGELRAQLQPLTFRENGNYLPTLFRNWPWPLDLSSGELQAQAHLRWRDTAVAATVNVESKQLGGFYNRTLFRGIDTRLRADYRDGRLSVPTQPFTIAEVQAGFPLRTIRGALGFDGKTIAVQDFSAQLFGGTIAQEALRYTPGAAANSLMLRIEQVQLAQILALQQGVEGSGLIDGVIPITLYPDGLRVDGAQLQARAPGGVLRYRGGVPAGAAQNPGLALAFTALENFHYDTMKVRADYVSGPTALGSAADTPTATSGDMLLAVALKGRNPTAPDTPPINFNLNIRENIPDLLHTLQIGADISARIEQRIKTLQQKQQRSRPQ